MHDGLALMGLCTLAGIGLVLLVWWATRDKRL